MNRDKWYRTIAAFFAAVMAAFMFQPQTIAQTSGEDEPRSHSYKPECASPPPDKFKLYKEPKLGVEIEVPEIWKAEYEKDLERIKFLGPDQEVCFESASLDYKTINGFLPGVPYSIEEGKKFFGQQWMKPHELIENQRIAKTPQGYPAIYSATDFLGILAVKFPGYKKPLILIIFTDRPGKLIETRLEHMLASLKRVAPKK